MTAIATAIGGETPEQRLDRLIARWELANRVASAAYRELRSLDREERTLKTLYRNINVAAGWIVWADSVAAYNRSLTRYQDARQRADFIQREMELARSAYLDWLEKLCTSTTGAA
jgi:hypothetical protein